MATGRIGTTPVLQVRWSKAPTNWYYQPIWIRRQLSITGLLSRL
jgi:hypothetical protein